MILGFYSHIPIFKRDDSYYIPSFIGIYINNLADFIEIHKLILISHKANNFESINCDFKIENNKIEVILLKEKKSAPFRFFFAWKEIIKYKRLFERIDYVIIRVPTPITLSLRLIIPRKKLIFLVVANDYEGAKSIKINSFRNFLIKYFLFLSDFILNLCLVNNKIFVNSPVLFEKYKAISNDISITSTSTVSKKDIKPKLLHNKNFFNLLYVGRIDPTKGLDYIINALAKLNKKKSKFVFNIVGWEDKKLNYSKSLRKKIIDLQIDKKIILHGKKKMGHELLSFYRKADIFIMPSLHESFPRTIWEAMASGCVVLTTNVGSIPLLLSHKKNCIMVEKKNDIQLNNSLLEIMNDYSLRKKLVKNGYDVVKNYTMENQLKSFIKKITI